MSAWRRSFACHDEVSVILGDLLDVEAEAYVSPANSYGYMDGGIDADLSSRFPGVERRVQAEIDRLGGLLPVGQAIVVETGDPFVPYLISAPTMEVPQPVGNTSNAFRAMLALLRAAYAFYADNDGAIGTIAVPGLCTGVGAMDPQEAARQMCDAYENWRAEIR